MGQDRTRGPSLCPLKSYPSFLLTNFGPSAKTTYGIAKESLHNAIIYLPSSSLLLRSFVFDTSQVFSSDPLTVSDTTASMSYHFVENNAIDEISRRRIRQHIMQGKNTGRRRCPRVPKATLTTVPRLILPRAPLSSANSSDYSSDAGSGSIPRSPGNALSYFAFPCELTPHMDMIINRCKYGVLFAPIRRLIIQAVLWAQMHSIFPVEFCKNLGPLRSLWFRFLQTSETCRPFPFSKRV